MRSMPIIAIVGAILVIAHDGPHCSMDFGAGEHEVRPYALIIGDCSLRYSHGFWSHT